MSTNKSCQLSILVNGEWAVPEPVVTENEFFGISRCGKVEEPDAVMKLDQRQELVIQKTGDVEVMIERGNRKRSIGANPIHLFANDRVHVGDVDIEILNIQYLNIQHPVLNPVVMRVLASSAAALSLFFVGYTGCSKEVANTNTPAQESISVSNAETSENAEAPVAENAEAPVAENAEAPVAAPENPDIAPEAPIEAPDIANVDAADDSSHCTEGMAMCLNNNRYLCVGKTWILIEECKYPAECIKNNGSKADKVETTVCEHSEPCVDGHYTCSPAVRIDTFNSRRGEIYKCKNKQWKLHETCNDRTSCYLESDTSAKCIEKARAMGKPAFGRDCDWEQQKCDSGNAIMICKNGFWKYKEICKEGEVCKSVSDKYVMCEKKGE